MYSFFKPLYDLSLTCTFALLQNLEALGLLSSSNGFAYYDLDKVAIFAGLYFIFIIFVLFPLTVLASLVLSKRLFVIIILIWFLPLLTNLIGLYAFSALVPEVYVKGSGGPDQMGLPEAALLNSFVIVVFSWSATTIVLHILRASKKSKSAFDHLWYIFGLSAIFFYVSDQSAIKPEQDYALSKSTIDQSFSRLHGEFILLDEKCKSGNFGNFSELCIWSQVAHEYLKGFQSKNVVEIQYSSIPSIHDLFTSSKGAASDEAVIRTEIRRFNQEACQKISNCRRLVVDLERYHPAFGQSEFVGFNEYALSIEALLPAITYHWKEFVKLSTIVKENDRKKNKRWVILVFSFSILIGMKIAHASREYFGGIFSSVYRKATRRCFVYLKRVFRLSLIHFKSYLVILYQFSRAIIASHWPR